MPLQVIGAGLGRTGTYSLKLALERLGHAPCFHMEEVGKAMELQVPLWNAALAGQGDWARIFDGYDSAVDWPTARFYTELHAAYPQAKFVLGTRDPLDWAESFAGTIRQFVTETEGAPPVVQDWIDMTRETIRQSGIPLDGDLETLAAAFAAHEARVRATIPAPQLLAFHPRDGWPPLCAFLGIDDVPDEPFPRTNNRSEFWDLVASLG